MIAANLYNAEAIMDCPLQFKALPVDWYALEWPDCAYYFSEFPERIVAQYILHDGTINLHCQQCNYQEMSCVYFHICS